MSPVREACMTGGLDMRLEVPCTPGRFREEGGGGIVPSCFIACRRKNRVKGHIRSHINGSEVKGPYLWCDSPAEAIGSASVEIQ